MVGFVNPDLYVFDVAAMEERGELIVRHRIPYSTLELSEEERHKGYGVDGPIEYSHTLTEQIGGQICGRLCTDRLHRGAAPRRRHRRLHAWLLRHAGTQAVTPPAG